MRQVFSAKKTVMAVAISLALGVGLTACGGSDDAPAVNPWMSASIIADQAAATTDAAKEAVANKRAKQLIAAMTLEQKLQQMTGSMPEILPELPNCYGARHVSGIAALNVPTFRMGNSTVGIGQNDCVSPSLYEAVKAGKSTFTVAYTSNTSAKVTALPAAIGAAASFDTAVGTAYGNVMGTEMRNLALHLGEGPGVNMGRLPVLGRNFEYLGEDPYLTGMMGTAQVLAMQAKGVIAQPKHFAFNEQETVRQYVQEYVDEQTMREIYLIPYEMAVRNGKAGSIMCAYNYVGKPGGKTSHSCESDEMQNKVLRDDWGFTGFVMTDFFSLKSTINPLRNGLDLEMPIPQYWSKTNLINALTSGSISVSMIDKALERRYTQMFKLGIFDRPIVQTPIDFAAGGQQARDIGAKAAVLLQNNGALPFATTVQKVVVIGKKSQVYAQQAVANGAKLGQVMGSGGGSGDAVPSYTVAPLDGIKNVLKNLGNTTASVQLILIDDENQTATIDGTSKTFADATAAAAGADAVIVMAGTIAQEGADRVTLTGDSNFMAATAAIDKTVSPAAGMSLDWYVADPANAGSLNGTNKVKYSNTVAMIQAIMNAASTTGKTMAQKTALVLKDNAGVSLDPSLLGASVPSLLEVWFPGQEDGHIVADLVFGQKNPGGKLPVTFPTKGKGFMDKVTERQFPGEVIAGTQEVEYTEKLHMGYRWYDSNYSGECAVAADGSNPCVTFPFGYGQSYTKFGISGQSLTTSGTNPNAGSANNLWTVTSASGTTYYVVKATVTNTGTKTGTEVVQAYLSLPASADAIGNKQPPKRLVGFQKVELAPGASKEVSIVIDPNANNHPLNVWSSKYSKWMTPTGTYTVYVGNSSSMKDLVKAGTFTK